MISPDGIKPIKRHIDTILNNLNPTTLKQLRSRQGNLNYCAKFVENHTAIIAPLSELTKGLSEDPKNVPIKLTPEALEAIRTMKKMFTQTLVLVVPTSTPGAVYRNHRR